MLESPVERRGDEVNCTPLTHVPYPVPRYELGIPVQPRQLEVPGCLRQVLPAPYEGLPG